MTVRRSCDVEWAGNQVKTVDFDGSEYSHGSKMWSRRNGRGMGKTMAWRWSRIGSTIPLEKMVASEPVGTAQGGLSARKTPPMSRLLSHPHKQGLSKEGGYCVGGSTGKYRPCQCCDSGKLEQRHIIIRKRAQETRLAHIHTGKKAVTTQRDVGYTYLWLGKGMLVVAHGETKRTRCALNDINWSRLGLGLGVRESGAYELERYPLLDTLHGALQVHPVEGFCGKGGSALTPEKSPEFARSVVHCRQQEPNAFEASFMKTVNRHEKEMKNRPGPTSGGSRNGSASEWQ
ncbi:hypothetical protein EDB85DRAFT_2236287 [Lactarius pseudohatsudake]|nr:hypothetical protein EDB85DRAFT_2236287 [Lactarius pseudohatsudake]